MVYDKDDFHHITPRTRTALGVKPGSVYHETTPRWVRAFLKDTSGAAPKTPGERVEPVVDSRHARICWENLTEPGSIPVYAFPPNDVDISLLRPVKGKRAPSSLPHRFGHGQLSAKTGGVFYDLVYADPSTGKQVEIRDAAWTYGRETPGVGDGLVGGDVTQDGAHVVFAASALDWYEEEEAVLGHIRDHYHTVTTIPSSRHVRFLKHGHVVADSKRPIAVFELGFTTRYYVPWEDVNKDLLVSEMPNSVKTVCPYKGVASYWTLRIPPSDDASSPSNEETYDTLLWSYTDPLPQCAMIKGLVSFYSEKMDVFVDGH